MNESQRNPIGRPITVLTSDSALRKIPICNIVTGVPQYFGILNKRRKIVAPFLIDKKAPRIINDAVLFQAPSPPRNQPPGFRRIAKRAESEIINTVCEEFEVIHLRIFSGFADMWG